MLPVVLIETMSGCSHCTEFMDNELDDLIDSLEGIAELVRIHNDDNDSVPEALRERAPITPGFLLFTGEEYAKYYNNKGVQIADIVEPKCIAYAVIEADEVTRKRTNLRYVPFRRARSAALVSAWVERCIKNLK